MRLIIKDSTENNKNYQKEKTVSFKKFISFHKGLFPFKGAHNQLSDLTRNRPNKELKKESFAFSRLDFLGRPGLRF